jgi:hypothetical protein
MEETFSQDFKKIFLLTFTRELIIHSAKKDILKLQGIIQLKEQRKKEKEKLLGEPIRVFTKEIGEEMLPSPKLPQGPIEFFPVKLMRKPITVEIKSKPFVKQVVRQKPIFKRPLFIPEPILPPHLQYLKPIPTPGVEIDLFKLNPLIKDIAVRVIEVNPDERVIVSGTMGTKPTSIVLSEEDIDKVIDKFSQVTKIPADEGIYRVVVGNLLLSAVVSDVTSSRFIIKKMITNPNLLENQQRYPLLPPSINMDNFLR